MPADNRREFDHIVLTPILDLSLLSKINETLVKAPEVEKSITPDANS